MSSRTKVFIRALPFFILLLLCLPPLHARAEDTPSVRVGYYEDGDYMYYNAQGQYEGYNFEFLQEISKLSGLRYEVVDTHSWQNALQLLIDGEIDILPSVYRTEERTEQMFFTDQPMCNIYTTLNVRMDDTRYDYEDFDAFQGMRVGIIRGGEDGESFRQYCEEHGVELSIIDYEETDALLEALEEGELDGVAITHLGRGSIFRSVAQFAPNPLYIAVSKKKPELLARINRAINDILLRNPGYQMDLYDKYLAPSANQQPVLTKEELEYIRTAEPIRVSYDPSFAPLAYRKPDGSFGGVAADIFSLISQGSGLVFTFEARTAAESLEALKQGETDVLSVVDGDYLWDERNNMNTTLYYLNAPGVLITGSDGGDVKTLALPEGYQLSERIARNNPTCTVLYYSSLEECFNAVLEGRAQATYTNTHTANYLLSDPGYDKLNATTLTQYPSDLCIGVSKSADSRLFTILDKYIQYMASEQVDDLLMKNSTVSRPISVDDFVRQHIWLVTGLVTAVLGSVILLLCINLFTNSRKNRRIQNLLFKDELTGLNNLNRFYIRSGELLREKGEAPYAVLYCDIDRFKLINDTFGFEEGDRVLRAFGQLLQQSMDSRECCARLSADNFVLLLECGDWDKLASRLTQLGNRLNQWRREKGVIPYEIGLSFGAYRVENDENHDLQQMLDLANYARHSAKDVTAGGIVLYDEKMRQRALLDQELEGRLSAALEQREFEAYYQPKVNMETGAIIGSEALVRWNHPEHGLLMPGSFVPFFEKKGLIVQVDLFLFESVCRTIRSWLDRGLPVSTVSCNFSRLHFGRPGFTEQIAAIADQYQVPHALLEVEITESAIASVPDSIAPVLTELKRLGFQIAIDDFGSGYSSLGQLQRLRADVLKLDRSFVGDGLQGKREQIVIENLVNMVRALGMSVICEGVETQEQARELLRMGCFLAQGFYYYRPMPAESLEQLMRFPPD